MREETVLLHATLCFLVKDGKVLLGVKARKIGQGCWNGHGGKIEDGETPEEAMVRELAEEAKITAQPESLEKVAVVDFHNIKTDGATFVCRVHTYLLRQWGGQPQATSEMLRPTWFDQDQLPLQDMMPADRAWLPVVLAGKKILAEAHYGPYQKTLLRDMVIRYVDSF